MKKLVHLIAFVTAVLPAWAALGDPRPDWVDGRSIEYPREMYLTGVGFGGDRSAAEAMAIGQISKIFSTVVSVDTNISESENNESGKKNSFSQSVSQSVRTASKAALEGVEIEENWRDEGSRQDFALAILDRAKAMAAINDKISELDAQVIQRKKQMDEAKEKMARVKAAMKLLVLLKGRSELNSKLRVLDADGKALAGSINEAEARPQAAKALSELDVVVNLSGDGSDEIQTGIINGLNQFGLQAAVGSANETGDIVIDGKISSSSSPSTDKHWKWARTTVAVSIKDGYSGKIISRFDASDRQASAEYNEAVRRTYIALSGKVSDQIKQAINDYFENQ